MQTPRDFILKLGRGLHRYGYAAHRLARTRPRRWLSLVIRPKESLVECPADLSHSARSEEGGHGVPVDPGSGREGHSLRSSGRHRGCEIKVVGKSGQISLGKRYAGKTLELQRLDDGTLLLRAVAMVPESQLWTLEEPHRSRIGRGLAWAAENRPRESDPDLLVKKKVRPRRRPPGRR